MLEYSEGHTGVAHQHLGRNHRTPPSPLGSPQCPTADGPHSQVDHYEGMAEDSWGTSEHGAWNTWRAGVTLSTPACSPKGQQPPHPYPQGSLTPTPRSAAPCPRSGQLAHQDCEVLPQRPTYMGCVTMLSRAWAVSGYCPLSTHFTPCMFGRPLFLLLSNKPW